jgi:hypothetical protein
MDEIRGPLFDFYKKARENPRKCYNPACHNDAIYSHVLQQKGVLNYVADKGIAVSMTDKLFIKSQFAFEKISIQKSNELKFKGFCNYCDTKIFKPIEDGEPKFTTYKEQLLLSYRGLLKTLDSKQVMYQFLRDSRASGLLDSERNKWHLERMCVEREVIKNKLYFKLLFEKELLNDTSKRNFSFHTIELPKIEIATSIAALPKFLYNITIQDKHLSIEKPKLNHKPHTDIAFINLVPTKDKLLLIFGCTTVVDDGMKLFYKEIANRSNDHLFIFITSFLLRSTKVWAISPALYKRFVDSGKDNIILTTFRENYIPFYDPSKAPTLPGFNMFEGEY